MMEEKRKYARCDFVERIIVSTFQETWYVGQSENIGLGGLFLATDAVLPPGTEGMLILTVDQNGETRNITSPFTVIHTNPSQKGSRGMGLACTDILPRHQTLLQDVICPA